MSSIGEKIREHRKWRGLTQQELADAIGISVMSIRRYESGERKPTEEMVKTIAEKLEVHPSEIDERFIVFLGSDVIIRTEDGEILRISAATREGKLLSNFQALNELGKDEVIRYADYLLDSDKYRRVPLDNSGDDADIELKIQRFLSLIGDKSETED